VPSFCHTRERLAAKAGGYPIRFIITKHNGVDSRLRGNDQSEVKRNFDFAQIVGTRWKTTRIFDHSIFILGIFLTTILTLLFRI